jgi:signal transduction histidine kinase/CheY-like chemotaxis protein
MILHRDPTLKAESSGKLLSVFVYGSLSVLLICLLVTAAILSNNFIHKEQRRAEISRDQLGHFFDFQYRALSEEMWTKNYEGINLRIGTIAKQLGHADYDVLLANAQGDCVYSSKASGRCATPSELKTQIPKFQSIPPEPVIEFDRKTSRYTYMIPLYVGSVLNGYLYSTLSDPYDFYRGDSVDLALRMVAAPIACVLLVWFLWLMISQRFILRPYFLTLVDLQKKRALGDLALQVAHDIRTPLVVLKSVTLRLQGLDPKQRRKITTAVSRIEGTANDLITRFSYDASNDSAQVSFVSAVTEAMVAEAEVLVGERSSIEVQSMIPRALIGSVVPISAAKLSRILSNIINNSIHALKNSQGGFIQIFVSSRSDVITLSVTDNGKGMTPETLKQVRSVGGSYGKPGGSGMGLQDAKVTLIQIGGSLTIDSTEEDGTTVTLEMPLAQAPKWFAQNLDLSSAETVVVLDDDPSIHLLWRERLRGKNVVCLNDPEQFDFRRFPMETTRYIFDYEISGSPVTGLDLITSHSLGSRAVLVTSHFNDPKIQTAIENAGTLMLPKFLIPSVEIKNGDLIGSAEAKSLWPDAGKESYPCHLALIDDDPMIREHWEDKASERGLSIHVVPDLAALDSSKLSLSTPIYIDLNLQGISGLVVAQRLHEKGYEQLFLSTGSALKKSQVPSFIRGITNKDFPAVFEVRV